MVGVCRVLMQISLTGGRWLNRQEARVALWRDLARSGLHGPWMGIFAVVEVVKVWMMGTSWSALSHLPDSTMSPMSFFFLGT